MSWLPVASYMYLRSFGMLQHHVGTYNLLDIILRGREEDSI